MKKKPPPGISAEEKLILQLYVSGMSPKSMEAIENITRLCNDSFANAYVLEIIDIYKSPELASSHQIIFSPSLVKQFPLPKKTLIGTFSDREKVLRILGASFRE
jgi:circadian clock protein KaiB